MSVTPAPDSAAKTLATLPSAAAGAASDLVIKGLTLDGQQFRPSDWSDRLCGVMSAFGADEQLRYSPLVQPALRDSIRCVIVKAELGALEPRLFKFFLSFAVENELQITYDADAVATLLPAAAKKLSVDGPPVLVRSAKSEDY
ncbi:MAG: DUF3579 domain-containing protein [Betaproteobacteria bacterium]|nr:MAG: DUF3579 domain-containing protein [Betaproteobacteria bacterium]